jgi:DNA-binding transcriptional ArsR family regulator
MKKRDARVWRALANEERRRMLDLLAAGPKTVGEIAGKFKKLSRFAVMQHLGVLEEARLIIVEARGRERLNYLNAAPIQAIYDRWISRFARPVAQIGSALKHFAEGESDGSEKKDVNGV